LAILLLKLTSNNHPTKGWLYGIMAWFGLYVVSIAIRLPTLEEHTFFAVVSHFLSASVYGLILTYTLNWFDKPNLKQR
jgi:hypothetical protein